MKLYTGGKDISDLIEKVTWSGDTGEVSRKLSFTLVKNRGDENFPSVVIDEGDEIIMRDSSAVTTDNPEGNIFGGIIFDIDKTASSKTETYLARDLMFYVNNSEINKMLDGTPESIAAEICLELGITCGELATTGIQFSAPCFGKKAYEAIMAAYTAAARRNGSKYILMMKNISQVCVIEKGTLSGVTLTGDYNLIEAAYKSSLQNLVNRVLITDQKGNIIKTVEDSDSIGKYGLIQKVMKQGDNEDVTQEAQAALTTIECSATLSGVPDDIRAVSGYSVIVQEPDTGLSGIFYIESDTHTFSCGKSQMDLTLAFENLMDEKELETAGGTG